MVTRSWRPIALHRSSVRRLASATRGSSRSCGTRSSGPRASRRSASQVAPGRSASSLAALPCNDPPRLDQRLALGAACASTCTGTRGSDRLRYGYRAQVHGIESPARATVKRLSDLSVVRVCSNASRSPLRTITYRGTDAGSKHHSALIDIAVGSSHRRGSLPCATYPRSSIPSRLLAANVDVNMCAHFEATLMSAESPISYLSLMIQVRYGLATKRLVHSVDPSQFHRRHAARRGAARRGGGDPGPL
jgi:hypothetical protein